MSFDWMSTLIAILTGLAVLLASLAAGGSSFNWVRRSLQSPWVMSLGSFPAIRLFASFVLGILIGVFLSSVLWGLTVAVLIVFGSRLHTQARKRFWLRMVERQIPEFCDALAGALRAGAALRSAVAQSRDQMALPIRQEIDRLQNLLRLGLSQEEALKRWADNSGIPAIRDLAFCAGVSSRSGGSLAPLVETIGQNLSAELALQAKADALTSQGRLQALVMIGIPPALLLMTGLIDASVWGFFFDSVLGSSLLWGVLSLELIGLLWIRKITRVRRSR